MHLIRHDFLTHWARSDISLQDLPKSQCTAVLALLYKRDGKLRVLLTTHSQNLWKHPGQAALPGGKVDPTDPSLIFTAVSAGFLVIHYSISGRTSAYNLYNNLIQFQEANKEVGLPLDLPHTHMLCLLPPFLSLYKLLVTPVVAFLTNNSLLQDLKPHPDEVDDIFDHPLEVCMLLSHS